MLALREARNQRAGAASHAGGQNQHFYRRIPVNQLADGVDRVVIADDQFGPDPDSALDRICVTRGLQARGIHGVLADVLVEADPAAEPGILRATQNDQARADGLRTHGGKDQRFEAFLGLVGDRQKFS